MAALADNRKASHIVEEAVTEWLERRRNARGK